MILRILDYAGVVLAAFFGFLSGLLGLLAGEIVGAYFWLVAVGVAGLCGFICLIFSTGDRILRRMVDAVFDWFDRAGTNTVSPRHLVDQDKELKYPSWIAFVIGVIVGFVAGSIFTPAEIMNFV
mgnify:CR=1 FL=1